MSTIEAPRSSRFAIVGIDGPDPRVVADPAVLDGHVEVDAHEHALARGIEVADGELVHGSSVGGCGRPFAGRRAGGGRGVRPWLPP